MNQGKTIGIRNFNSIKTKLILLMVLVLMSTVTAIKVYDYTVRAPQLEQEVRDERTSSALLVASTLQTELKQSTVILETSAINTTFASDDNIAITKALQVIKAQNPLFETVFLTDANLTRMNEKGEFVSLASREYMKQVKKTKKTFISQEVLISKATNNLSIMIATPIKVPGAPERYLGVSVGVAAFQNIINQEKKSESTYAFLFDGKDGMLFAHPVKEYIGALKLINTDEKDKGKVMPELRKMAEEAVAGKNGTLIYEFNGTKIIAAYTNIPGTSFGVVSRINFEEAMYPIQKERISALFITLIASLIGIALAFFFASLITSPLISIAKQADIIAEGDFTAAGNILIKNNDEVGHLQKAFKEMAVMLKTTMISIGQTSVKVASFSKELNAGAEQSARDANQVMQTVAKVSGGAAEQAKAVDKTTDMIKQIGNTIDQIANKAVDVASLSREALVLATNGGESIGHAVNQMANINNTVRGTAVVIKELGLASDQIGQIINTISAIAGQTNLLALNAAIEAARAGEQGRGFAVVADEVRKLAEESKEATNNIGQIIGNIQAKTKDAIGKMDNSAQEVLTGQNVVLVAGESFKQIQRQILAVNESVQEITSATRQLSSSSSNVIVAVEKVKDISHGTVTNSQTISAAATEQSSSMEEISTMAESLSQLANQLQETIRQYKF